LGVIKVLDDQVAENELHIVARQCFNQVVSVIPLDKAGGDVFYPLDQENIYSHENFRPELLVNRHNPVYLVKKSETDITQKIDLSQTTNEILFQEIKKLIQDISEGIALLKAKGIKAFLGKSKLRLKRLESDLKYLINSKKEEDIKTVANAKKQLVELINKIRKSNSENVTSVINKMREIINLKR